MLKLFRCGKASQIPVLWALNSCNQSRAQGHCTRERLCKALFRRKKPQAMICLSPFAIFLSAIHPVFDQFINNRWLGQG
jgi:hypothetical protein